jgi:ABC-type Fe3+-hydroxamate transport system substrate-binding protein
MSLRTFTDQLGNALTIPFPPQRIISLVPSQTELLADLQLNNRVVGITKFCIHPQAWRESKTIIGGTKQFRFDVIQSLQPDLIIGNKEENYQEGIDQLRLTNPVWMSDIITLEDAQKMIEQVGELTDTSPRATVITGQIRNVFAGLEQLPPLRTLYLIWRNPWMGAASGTFIHEMMTLAGLNNCLSHHSRYPELTHDDLQTLNPELILLSSEPYPFQQKHVMEIQALCPAARIVLADGEMFSWYGSRLAKFPAYVKSLIPVLY